MTNRFGGRAWIHAAGWWLILSTLNLHFLGSSFALTLLLDRGVSNWQRRLVFLVLAASLIGGVFWWAKETLPGVDIAQLNSFDSAKDYFRQLLSSGPAPILLYPFRLVVRPYLAQDVIHFFYALGPALVVMALHYFWVARSNVAFEEASVEASKKLADKIVAIRSGRRFGTTSPRKAKRAPFKLQASGSPAVAFLWKNLISAGQAFTFRIWIIVASIAIGTCAALRGSVGSTGTCLSLV